MDFPSRLPLKNDRLTQKRKKCAACAAEIVFILKFSAGVVLKSAKFNNYFFSSDILKRKNQVLSRTSLEDSNVS